jgi:TorA maturation chaperone TorD
MAMRFQKIRTKHLNFLTRRHLMTLIYKYADAVEEVAVGTLSTLAVLAVPVLIIIASV